MFPTKIKVCDLFGIPIFIDISFLILLGIMVIDYHSFSYGLTVALLLALSITLHELGHSLMARVFGFNAREITLSLLGGCASFIRMPKKASQEFLVALAGPLVSFLIVGVAFALSFLPISNDWLAFTIVTAFWMNIMLGGFNLLPGFPMDGGRIFRSIARIFVSRVKATYAAMIIGRGFAILLGLRGLWSLINGGSWSFVTILIAWMIWKEGYREYQLAVAEENRFSFSARVSPPPYGGDDDEVEISRR